MITSTIGDFTFYISTKDEEFEITDPFNYQLVIDNDQELQALYTSAICNNIPCPYCELQLTCKDGKHRSTAIYEYANTHFPELLI